MKKYLFYKTFATSLIAVSLLLSPFHRPALAQNNAQDNLDRAGENLEDAGQNLLEATDEATAEAQQEIAETAEVIEQNANWGWLGLLGLFGLFGLKGRRKEKVVHHYETDPNVIRTPSTDYRR
ncbi:WGxxGxxG family protein [Capilliphycus salinus ALCB114379]|uniref:WGxxGxxG family protein n=1 Tax=Capilliphycus salinus TaxID=2768948 RepID=UPI0039A547AC